MFDSRLIEYVLCIAEKQSLTAAAESLFITQSALSQQLAKLTAAGLPPLFEYRGRKMLPTAAGKIYINSAKSIMALKEKSEKRIQEYRDAAKTQLRVLLLPEFSDRFRHTLFPDFLREFPEISLEVRFIHGLPSLVPADAEKYDILLLVNANPQNVPLTLCCTAIHRLCLCTHTYDENIFPTLFLPQVSSWLYQPLRDTALRCEKRFTGISSIPYTEDELARYVVQDVCSAFLSEDTLKRYSQIVSIPSVNYCYDIQIFKSRDMVETSASAALLEMMTQMVQSDL